MDLESPRHILIIEDAPDLQSLLTELLTGEGYQVSCADNGRQALDLLRSARELPACILLDIMMPIMDGLEFREEQRKDPRLAPIPVAVMTADLNPEAKAAAMGIDSVVRKPVSIERLLAIAKALSRPANKSLG